MLPITNLIDKELLPICGVFPAIDLIIEECIVAGIEEFYIITRKSKKTFNYYLKRNFSGLKINLIYQDSPKGLGDAIRIGLSKVKAKYFLLTYPDNIILDNECKLDFSKLLIDRFNETNNYQIAVNNIPLNEINLRAIVFLNDIDGFVMEIRNKPNNFSGTTPLAACGRFILPTKIKGFIPHNKDTESEIEFTPILNKIIEAGDRINTFQCEYLKFDIGNPKSYFSMARKLDDNCVEKLYQKFNTASYNRYNNHGF